MTALDCACCGLAIELQSPVLEDSRHICPGCGATCQVFFEDPDTDNRPYFGSWKCSHGIDGDEACDACESDGVSAVLAASTVLDQVAVLARSATASAQSLLAVLTGDPDLQACGPAMTTAEAYELWRAAEPDCRDEDGP